ncbi:hypothetical protein PVAP13_5KG595200 [Panicum virgatum]|uniref:Uncharacterized protein n=1 Tax=Panicum virgatum TaxID=38727 RepID=A0A8T0SNA7_PANVG|nr:hypothetical protein PVAP13_5KG595200 [Panicum virgatum]
MAISSSSGSNSFGDSSSSSSSSSLSASSIDSIPESREPTPEWDPIAAYEALAPLHWDAEEFDFGTVSKEDEPETEGEEDLQFLFQEELESSEDDVFSWEGTDSSEEIDSSFSDDTTAGGNPHQFLKAPMEGSEEGSSSSDEDDGNSSSDDDDDDGGDASVRSPKRRRHSNTYDW